MTFGRAYTEALQALTAHWNRDDTGAALDGPLAAQPALGSGEQP